MHCILYLTAAAVLTCIIKRSSLKYKAREQGPPSETSSSTSCALMMPASQPSSAIGSPETSQSFSDDAAVTRSVSAIVTNNTLPRLVPLTCPVTPTHPRRPLLDRSVSSPHVDLTPNRGSTRSSPFPSVAHNREWTLFGQLMEDEGQLRPSRRRTIQHSASDADHDRSDPFVVSSSVPLSPLPEPARAPTPDLDEYCSDDSDDSDDPPEAPAEADLPVGLRIPTLSRLQKNVLKCGLAYLLSSLFTFIPYLSSFLTDIPSQGEWSGGPSPAGHMVATVCV